MYIVTGAMDGIEHPTSAWFDEDQALDALRRYVDTHYDVDLLLAATDEDWMEVAASFKAEAESIIHSAWLWITDQFDQRPGAWTYGHRQSAIWNRECGDWCYAIVRY